MNLKKKLKTLIPTLRERERYIAFQVISENPINYIDLEKNLWDVMEEFLGEYGLSKTSLWLIKNLYNPKSQTGVIRCNHKSLTQVLACLGLISRVGESRVVFKILKISGTIKGLG
ncbi:MAG: Rpp14/Pop5 family protein, partial [Candidatus Aenigmatarchaeota archaeon]